MANPSIAFGLRFSESATIWAATRAIESESSLIITCMRSGPCVGVSGMREGEDQAMVISVRLACNRHEHPYAK